VLPSRIEEIDRPPTPVGRQHPLCRFVEALEVSRVKMLCGGEPLEGGQ
jgi:hypothetical protein